MKKLTELFENYINSFDNTEVTLVHGQYIIFNSQSQIVTQIKKDINPFGIRIETVGKESYRFSVSYPKGQLQEMVNVLVERVA